MSLQIPPDVVIEVGASSTKCASVVSAVS
jgi:hypothetical protein